MSDRIFGQRSNWHTPQNVVSLVTFSDRDHKNLGPNCPPSLHPNENFKYYLCAKHKESCLCGSLRCSTDLKTSAPTLQLSHACTDRANTSQLCWLIMDKLKHNVSSGWYAPRLLSSLEVIGLRDLGGVQRDSGDHEGSAIWDPALGHSVEAGPLDARVLQLRISWWVKVQGRDLEGNAAWSFIKTPIWRGHPMWYSIESMWACNI